MLESVLLFIFIGFSLAQCPFGFTDDGNGNCYSDWYDGLNHTSAYALCAHSNSFMFDISNAFVNSEVQESAQGKDKVWLGLTCLNSSVATCQWDNGRQVTAYGYTNFVNGKPNPVAGACVYMQVSNGYWYNSDCTTTTASARCQNVPALPVKIPYCVDGSIYFRGNCYWGAMVQDEKSGIAVCGAGCGKMASIHSDGENSIVADVAALNPDTKYGFLSLSEAPSSPYKWADGSNYDYSHWGYQNDGLGTCVSIAAFDDVVKKGYWMSYPCTSTASFSAIYVINACDPLVGTTTCDGTTTILRDSGPIYSPGYPAASGPTTCEFMLTVNATYGDPIRSWMTVAVNFLDISLDKKITDTTENTTTFLSTGDMVKIVFKTTGFGNNFFRGYFGDGRVPCDNGTYYGSGNYSMPYDPNGSNIPVSCEIRFLSSKKTVNLLQQDVVGTFPKFYDGYGNSLSIKNAYSPNATVQSLSPVLRMSFDSSSHGSFTGVLASFVSN